MDGLRPVGSELINDPDAKLQRILEMAGIKKKKDTANAINENKDIRTKKKNETVLHKAVASDGTVFGIVQEGKHVYVKEAVDGVFEYIGGVQNLREHSYKTYADALKHMNLMFKEINVLSETKKGTSILGEGYKLKIGGGNTPAEEPVADEPAMEPELGDDLPAEEPAMDSGEGDDENKIQKLAGKLAQEVRDAKEGEVDDELAKSVTNTVLSATEELLTPEAKDEIINNLETEEEAPVEEPALGNDDVAMEEGWMAENDQINPVDDVEEHNEPMDPSPMSKPGDHDLQTTGSEMDNPTPKVGAWELFEQACDAALDEANGSGDIKAFQTAMNEMLNKVTERYTKSMYEGMGRMYEASVNEDDTIAKELAEESATVTEETIEEHNEPNDPSPMSKPGDHEVKKETPMDKPEQETAAKNDINGTIKNAATKHVNESEEETTEEVLTEEEGKPGIGVENPDQMTTPKNEVPGHVKNAATKDIEGSVPDEKAMDNPEQETENKKEIQDKKETQLENPDQATKGRNDVDAIKDAATHHINGIVPTEKAGDEPKPPTKEPAKINENKELNEAVNFLKNKISEIKSRLDD